MTIVSLGAVVPALITSIAGALIGGAVGGIAVGGKLLGNQLAATMGSFFGPLAAIPGLVIGLVILSILG